jgi:hypothetical protein
VASLPAPHHERLEIRRTLQGGPRVTEQARRAGTSTEAETFASQKAGEAVDADRPPDQKLTLTLKLTCRTPLTEVGLPKNGEVITPL